MRAILNVHYYKLITTVAQYTYRIRMAVGRVPNVHIIVTILNY